MKEESVGGSSESTAQFCFEHRRPKLIKLGSLNKSQMDQYLTYRIKFSFLSEVSTAEWFTSEKLESSLTQGGSPRRARSVKQFHFNYITHSIGFHPRLFKSDKSISNKTRAL